MWTLSDETKHTNMITTCQWHKQEACLSFNYFLKLLEDNNWPQEIYDFVFNEPYKLQLSAYTYQ